MNLHSPLYYYKIKSNVVQIKLNNMQLRDECIASFKEFSLGGNTPEV